MQFSFLPTSAFFLGEQQRVRDPRGGAVARPVAPAPAAVVPVGEAVVVPAFVQGCQIARRVKMNAIKWYVRNLVVGQEQFKAPGKSMYFLLSRTQAGPGRTVKQEQEEISRNHVQTFSGCSV